MGKKVVNCWFITSGEAGRWCSLVSLSVVLLSLSLSDPELLSEPLWLLESSRDCSAPSLLLLFVWGNVIKHHEQGGFGRFSYLCKNGCHILYFHTQKDIKDSENMNCSFFCLCNYLPCDVFLEAFLAESCSPSLSSLLLSFRSSSSTLTLSTMNLNSGLSWNTKICCSVLDHQSENINEGGQKDEALTLAGHHRFWAGGCLSSWKN